MGNPEKSNGMNGYSPSGHHSPTSLRNAAAHHAIKIIPEDVELSSGIQRSRASSVQLHVPLMSTYAQDTGVVPGGPPGPSTPKSPIDIDFLAAKDAIDPPLPSPAMLRPFRKQSYPAHPRARRGWIYVFAIIGGCVTFIVLLVLLLSHSSTAANVRLRAHAEALSSSSSASFSRVSSYLGSYLPFLESSAALGSLTASSIIFGHVSPGSSSLHPILPLLKNARKQHENLMARQSTSLAQAMQEYRKRYGRKPPKGFEKWWSFAKARNHTMVDEYDSMMRDLSPFYELSPDVLRTRTRTLAGIPGVSLISIKDGASQIHSKSGRWAPALALQEMMNAFVAQLPDMEIAVNEKQEGRVLPGVWKEVNLDEWADEDLIVEEVSEANKTDPLADVLKNGRFKNDWRRDGNTWEAFRRACPPDSAARRLVESIRSAESSVNSRQMRLQKPSAALQQQEDVQYTSSLSRRRAVASGALPRTRELSFNRVLDAEYDICAMPSLHTLHSAFFSDIRSIGYLYPLFSPSKPTGFADLLVPFHQYWSSPSEVTYENEFKKGRVKFPLDPEWEDKDDKVFWRGKVTRGAETPPGHFSSFQKPRLVRLANDDGSIWTHPEGDPRRVRLPPRVLPHRVLVTVNASSSSLVSMSAPAPRINEYTMDVALSCDPQLGECAEQERLGYKTVVPGPLSAAWKHKYLLDLDEVGLSNRFPALMESKSAVVKSSIQREFWRDWIVPWYHFIPLSSSYAELYNIQAFFSGFPQAFQNRRAMSSTPSAPSADEDAVVSEVTLEEEGEEDDGQGHHITITSHSTKLPPINPAHGDIFSGDLALKDIAYQGSAWTKEHLRREDMEVYVFRLMIEWAALLNGETQKAVSSKKGKTGKA